VFPELSLTGYELDLANELAFSQDAARLLQLIDAASSHRTTLIVGAPVRIESRLYIGALIIFPNRAVTRYGTRWRSPLPTTADRAAGLASAGRSAIWSETRAPLVELETRGTGVAIAIRGPEGCRAQRVMID
jgi:hypothetical protein